MLPVWYTLFAEYCFLSKPMIRPIWWEAVIGDDDESYKLIYDNDDSFLVGNSLIIRPIVEETHYDNQPTTTVPVYLPILSVSLPMTSSHIQVANWYRYTRLGNGGEKMMTSGTHNLIVSPDEIPVFVRAGSLFFTKDRQRRSSESQSRDPYTMNLYLHNLNNSTQWASGSLYVDDHKTFNFERGAYRYKHFTYREGVLTSSTGTFPKENLVPESEEATVEVPGVSKIRIVGLNHPTPKVTLTLHNSQRSLPVVTVEPLITDSRDSAQRKSDSSWVIEVKVIPPLEVTSLTAGSWSVKVSEGDAHQPQAVIS
eukprot:GHVN01059238.1.p1 GENE.GHVN01059238.1~~GHVN01059238.1.p1  ORF type:complete len:365 (-),score=88.74 GHVN01059238.1:422-1354(-)